MKYRMKKETEWKGQHRKVYALNQDIETMKEEAGASKLERIEKSTKLPQEMRDQAKAQKNAKKAEVVGQRAKTNVLLVNAEVTNEEIAEGRRKVLKYFVEAAEEEHAWKTMLIEDGLVPNDETMQQFKERLEILEIEHATLLEMLDSLPPEPEPEPKPEKLTEEIHLPREHPEIIGDPVVDPKEEGDASEEIIVAENTGQEDSGS